MLEERVEKNTEHITKLMSIVDDLIKTVANLTKIIEGGKDEV